MYGFPTQTAQDTVDALEYVRQLFAAGCIQSAFFHRFTCTVHSPVGKHPEQYGVSLAAPLAAPFANNDINFTDHTGVDHDLFGAALRKALYNYMLGIGLDLDVREWFAASSPGQGYRQKGSPSRHRRRATHNRAAKSDRTGTGLSATVCLSPSTNRTVWRANSARSRAARPWQTILIDEASILPVVSIPIARACCFSPTMASCRRASRSQASHCEGLLGAGGRHA